MSRILVTEEIAEGGLDRLRAAGHEVVVELDLAKLSDPATEVAGDMVHPSEKEQSCQKPR